MHRLLNSIVSQPKYDADDDAFIIAPSFLTGHYYGLNPRVLLDACFVYAISNYNLYDIMYRLFLDYIRYIIILYVFIAYFEIVSLYV